MCEIDCCGMYKDGTCLENNVPCKDIQWRHCTLKAVKYAENKELEVKNLKAYNEYLQTHYKNILENVKQDMQIIQELMDLYINKQVDLSKND